MIKNFKVSHKLTLLLLVISVVPLLAGSLANYYRTKVELEKKTIDALQAVLDSRAAHINHAIQLRQEQAKGFAGAFLLRQLKEAGSNDPQVIQGIQNDVSSAFSYLNLSPGSSYHYIDKKTDIAVIGVWDVYGNIIAGTDRSLIGQKMPIEYLQNLYNNKSYFRGFETDPWTSENLLVHLEEIRNWHSDLIVGAIALKVRAQLLNEITTARQGLGKSGETYLVDNQSFMITPSRFVKDAVLKVRVVSEATRACFANRKAPSIYKNYRGVDVLGVQKYLPDEDWCLLAEIDAQEALAPIRDFKRRTLSFGGLLICVILVFAYYAGKSFLSPILKLHAASQQVALGNYQVRVPVESRDEIGGLTGAFNEMAGSLAKITEQLEQKSKILFQHLAVSTKQKKELKEVNEELDRFVYTASHDLRAPLRGIASFASFLEEDYKNKLDEQGKDYINEIRKGASKMNDLIEDLLTLSRISRIKNPYEDVDMKELIPPVLERIKFDIKDKKVDLQIQEKMPVVRCDRIKIAEVFLNLINNAIKFSSKNNKEHPKVQVGYIEDGDAHKFFVKDNGIGIDPKYHSQIFGIFKRLHTDKEYEGTGAGLSIIKRVVEDHQGKVWVESQLGSGATFFFTIPKDLRDNTVSEEDVTDDSGGQ